MLNQNTQALTFDTFTDIDLYDLAETTQNEDYKKLSAWIYNYKYKQLLAQNEQFEADKRNEFKREYGFLKDLVETYISLKKSPPKISIKDFIEKYRIRKRITSISNLIYRNIIMNQMEKEQFIDYLKKKNYDNSFKHFISSLFKDKERYYDDISIITDNNEKTELEEFIEKKVIIRGKRNIENVYIDIDKYITQYEQKLKDHIFLLEELVEILNTEYDRRIINTKKRFEEYLRPLKRMLNRIDEEIKEIAEDIVFLTQDDNIKKEDKKKLKKAFIDKRNACLSLKKREVEKLNSIKMVSQNIREGVKQFKNLIDNLKKKVRYYKKRQFYMEKLARYGADIPKFRNILDDLYNTFNHQIKRLQKSFLLFDISFQESILNAIEDQSVINRIILSPRGIVDAELAIENHQEPAENIDINDLSILENIELDLSYLTPYQKAKEHS